MRVGELINLLADYASDTEVERWNDEHGIELEIEGVYLEPAQPGDATFGPRPRKVVIR